MRFSGLLSAHDRILLVIALGGALVAAAAFAPIGTSDRTYSYEVAEVSPDSDWPLELVASDEVLACWDASTDSADGWAEAQCQFAVGVHEDGPVVIGVNNTSLQTRAWNNQLVYFEATNQFYAPRSDYLDNGSNRLHLDPVSNQTAMGMTAIDAESFPPESQRLFKRGSLRTEDPIAGWRYWTNHHGFVEHEDTFYRQVRAGVQGHNNDKAELVRRVLTALVGVGLLLYSRQKYVKGAE